MSDDKTDPLTALLDGLPIGISARVAGVPFYQNRLGREHEAIAPLQGDTAVEARTINVQRLSLGIFGADCEVHLSRDVTEQRELENELFKRAYFDDLTKLPNRALIERSCARLIETMGEHGSFALAFVDLDGFKNINDYYGHGTGDRLLVKIAERLSSELRPSDMLARVGGDEFVLLLAPIDTVASANGELSHILERLKVPFFIDGHELFASASVGVSLYPLDGRDYDTLCAKADRAMYRTKTGTKGSLHFYDTTHDDGASDRMKIEQRLRLAVRDRRVTCVYQPKVDFRSNQIVGVEVLLRWRDEEGVIHPPGDFVNLAVELGLMDEITHLVLAETVRSIDRINEAFGNDCTVSLNVAAKQADMPIFMRSLLDAIASTGNPSRFMLELTEEAFLTRSRFQTTVLPMIRDLGVRVSIDDFGVGYSSLAALAEITADELKVDRSFITDIHRRPRSQSVLKAIESLAQALDMSILVEGVETAEELLYLQAATRIRLAQGYYFARPALLDDIVAPRAVSTFSREAAQPGRYHQIRQNQTRG